MASSTSTLSPSDAHILTQIFNPETPSSSFHLPIPSQQPPSEPSANEKEAIRLIEEFESSHPSSTAAERESTFQTALSLLSSSPNPTASELNNRAQLRRWYHGSGSFLDPKRALTPMIELILSDLHSALSLPANPKTLAAAHTQLATIYHSLSKELSPVEINGELWTQEKLTAAASRNFYLGGQYGNEIAKQMAIVTNPHAKLCGEIVREAMRKEMEEFDHSF